MLLRHILRHADAAARLDAYADHLLTAVIVLRHVFKLPRVEQIGTVFAVRQRNGRAENGCGTCSFLLLLRMLAHRLNFRLVEQHTAAVTLKCWKADDFQVGVNFRTVVGDLQSFAIERRALIDP